MPTETLQRFCYHPGLGGLPLVDRCDKVVFVGCEKEITAMILVDPSRPNLFFDVAFNLLINCSYCKNICEPFFVPLQVL